MLEECYFIFFPLTVHSPRLYIGIHRHYALILKESM